MRKVAFLTAITILIAVIHFRCTREDSFLLGEESFTDAFAESSQPLNAANSFNLPVNLFEYNLSCGAKTKSSFSSAQDAYNFHFKQDSLLSDVGVRQVYFEETKWIYTEFPFKSNGSLYAAITSDKSHIADSLVTIKCFYLLLDNYATLSEWMEYIVTMIPTKSYVTQYPEYSFLDMPSFSGLVLYSSLEGEFLRSEHYQDGTSLMNLKHYLEKFSKARYCHKIVMMIYKHISIVMDCILG